MDSNEIPSNVVLVNYKTIISFWFTLVLDDSNRPV